MNRQPIYLDCAASTPMEPEVIEFITHHFKNTWGNPHSRTHEFGSRARSLVETAREQVAKVVNAKAHEVIFTSGATEANNIVIQSMIKRAARGEKVHVLASCIEHPSVLEPLKHIEQKGVEVELVDVLETGRLNLDDFQSKLKPSTSMVSIMQVNSETGIKQPLAEVCEILKHHGAALHVDAAQGFGKDFKPLRNERVDLISCSSHKVFGPKGVGALITRSNHRTKELVVSLFGGGGQERQLRSGTVPAPLVGGFGLASELAVRDHQIRKQACNEFGNELFSSLSSLPHTLIGDNCFRLASTANIAFPGIDSETFMILTRNIVSVSNGTACASSNYVSSPVLAKMGVSDEGSRCAIRFSWAHFTTRPDWSKLVDVLQEMT